MYIFQLAIHSLSLWHIAPTALNQAIQDNNPEILAFYEWYAY